MSDEKKRDRALQQRVRDRQTKTGERYQAAWRHLTTSEPPSSANAPQGARRVPLSLSTSTLSNSVKVLPGQSAQITVRPQLASFWPDRVLIKNADRWDIHRLAVENYEDPDEFSLIEAGSREATAFSLDTWQPLIPREIRCGEKIVVQVTYTGSNTHGENFEATLFGWEGCPPTTSTDRREDREDDDRISERATSGKVPTGKTVQLPLTVKAPTLFVDRLTIADAKDWVVHDVRTHGKSILVQSGDLPGEMFSDSARVILEPLTAGSLVEVVATYVGSTSARLQIELSGSTKTPSSPREFSGFLPMSTGVPILPTQSAQITGRPQVGFLPERLVISDHDAWIINDITVGIQRQLAALGDLPGQSFSSRAVGSHMTLDPVRMGQDFVLVVTRGEDYKAGAPFFCGVQGRFILEG